MSSTNEPIRGQRMHGPTNGYGFTIQREYGDTGNLQFIREFTKNAIQAIQGTEEGRGQARWDHAANLDLLPWSDLAGSHVGSKLMVVDNGIGFDPDGLAHLITGMNQSTHEQSMTGNYGVGGKISALPRNKFGVVYLAFRDGNAYATRLRYFPDDNDYAIEKALTEDGYADVAEFDADYARETWLSHVSGGFPMGEHGTAVIFLGNSAEEDTTTAPADSPSRGKNWIRQYLNRRFATLPEGIKIKAPYYAEKGDAPPSSMPVRGEVALLDRWCEWRVEMELPSACATIWCLKEERQGSAPERAVGSHVATVMDGEMYDWVQGGPGSHRLKRFGITDGYQHIAMHIEPRAPHDSERFRPNKPRTRLMMASDAGNELDLPWDDWYYAMANNPHPKVAAYVESVQAANAKEKSESVKDALSEIADLIQFSPARKLRNNKDHYFKPNENGPHLLGPLDLVGDTPREDTGETRGPVENPDAGTNADGGSDGEPNQRAGEANGAGRGRGRKVTARTPDGPRGARTIVEAEFVRISADLNHPLREGPRMSFQSRDMAAFFTSSPRIGKVGRVELNLDWPEWGEMVAHCCREAGLRQPSDEQKKTAWMRIEYHVKLKLNTAILKTMSFKHTRDDWGNEELDRAWCPSALTFLCSDMWHVCDAVVQEMKGKSRSRRAA